MLPLIIVKTTCSAALVLCCLALIHAETREIDNEPQTNRPREHRSRNDVAFELPDLTAQEDTPHGEIQLEAFKATQNDRILQENKLNTISQLYWVSIGHPKMLRMRSRRNASIWSNFHFKSDGFYIKIQMLTQEHKKILSDAARQKYKLPINSTQIKHLVLSQFECNIELYENRNKYMIKGAVTDFRTFPLRMDFRASVGSRERRLFSEKLALSRSDATEEIELTCSLASSGKRVLTNRLVISSKLSQDLGLTEKLFGPVRRVDQAVYVTRNQLTSLSAEVYSALNVVEDYEMPEYQFSDNFIEELVKQTAVDGFQQVDFNEAIENLSKFGIDFGADLKPDEIQRDFGKIFKVSTYDNKSHIIVNEEQLKHLQKSGSSSSGRSASISFRGIGLGRSVSAARTNSEEWMEGKKSLNDQIRELNSASTDEVEWEIEGNRVIPKSINVVKISNAKFGKTLTFNRIRRHYFEAEYQRKIRLYSGSSNSIDNNENLRKEIQRLQESDQSQRRKIESLTESDQSQRRKIESLTESDGSQRKKIESLTESNENNRVERNRLQERNENNQREIQRLNEGIENQRREIQSLQGRPQCPHCCPQCQCPHCPRCHCGGGGRRRW